MLIACMNALQDAIAFAQAAESKVPHSMKMPDGQFVMTRSAVALPADLSDASLRGLELKPGIENTLLLYDNPDLGVRFLYPRDG